jgi:hypothetical protein
VENWQNMLSDNYKEIIYLIGDENILKLWSKYNKGRIEFPEKPLNKIRIAYIKKHYTPARAAKIARILGVSQVFVSNHAPRSKRIEAEINQMNMFDKST